MHFYWFVARSIVLITVAFSLTPEMAYHKCKHYRIVFWSLLGLTLLHFGEAVCYGLRLMG